MTQYTNRRAFLGLCQGKIGEPVKRYQRDTGSNQSVERTYIMADADLTAVHPRVYIYVLSDPLTGDIRYVGKTIKRLNDRLKIHIWAAKQGNKTHRCAWIRSLLGQGLIPKIAKIEDVEDVSRWAEREQYWIATYRAAGLRLTNATAGGEGWHGLKHTDEAKEKIGAAHRGKIISPDQKIKLSIAMTGKVPSTEVRRKISEGGMGRIMSDATKAKISIARTGIPCPKTAGEGNGRARITAEQASEIRGSDMTLSEIMSRYKISKSQSSRVRRGAQW